MLKIKIATFKSILQHSNQFDKEIQSFLSAIEQGIHTSLEFAPLEDYDCDLKLIFIVLKLYYSSSLFFIFTYPFA